MFEGWAGDGMIASFAGVVLPRSSDSWQVSILDRAVPGAHLVPKRMGKGWKREVFHSLGMNPENFLGKLDFVEFYMERPN